MGEEEDVFEDPVAAEIEVEAQPLDPIDEDLQDDLSGNPPSSDMSLESPGSEGKL